MCISRRTVTKKFVVLGHFCASCLLVLAEVALGLAELAPRSAVQTELAARGWARRARKRGRRYDPVPPTRER